MSKTKKIIALALLAVSLLAVALPASAVYIQNYHEYSCRRCGTSPIFRSHIGSDVDYDTWRCSCPSPACGYMWDYYYHV